MFTEAISINRFCGRRMSVRLVASCAGVRTCVRFKTPCKNNTCYLGAVEVETGHPWRSLVSQLSLLDHSRPMRDSVSQSKMDGT